MKIVLNGCFGGLGFSESVYKELGIKPNKYGYMDNEMLGIKSDDSEAFRADSRLIAVIEKLGTKKSSSADASLYIKEIKLPKIVDIIENYDGKETLKY
jgi:hypothetical protein